MDLIDDRSELNSHIRKETACYGFDSGFEARLHGVLNV